MATGGRRKYRRTNLLVARLTVHPDKSLVSAMEGFNFLGNTFWTHPNNREEGPRWYHDRRCGRAPAWLCCAAGVPAAGRSILGRAVYLAGTHGSLRGGRKPAYSLSPTTSQVHRHLEKRPRFSGSPQPGQSLTAMAGSGPSRLWCSRTRGPTGPACCHPRCGSRAAGGAVTSKVIGNSIKNS